MTNPMSEIQNPKSPNPYVGPRTFEEKDAQYYYGREREARELLSMVISEPVVLFYAQSGAGKSSMINTRLIPGLRQENFIVLPVARVSGEAPEGVQNVSNIFVYNLLIAIDQGKTDPHSLAQTKLTDYLQANKPEISDDSDYDQPARVLIIDQFEEIVTTHLDQWKKRRDFFKQLNRAVRDDPYLWVVMTLREDYVASLDPYARLIPGKLRTRFHMQRMASRAGLEAIEKPAEMGGRPFAPGVASILVNNLRQIRIPGESETQAGEFVEPVQLQVVCYQLWENLKDRPPGEITEADLEELGDVDAALGNYYEQAIAQVIAETNESELNLRMWFDRQLITEAGTRGTVYKGEHNTAGLANSTVEKLAQKFLLRGELRAGGTWYELVHDRFVPPIIRANQDWIQQKPLIQAARNWDITGRNKANLLLGEELYKARESIENRPIEPLVMEFLTASEAENYLREEQESRRQKELEQAQALAQAEAENARNQNAARRRLLILLVALTFGFIISIGLTYYAIVQTRRADAESRLSMARQLIALALTRADDQPDLALLLALEANQTTPGVADVQGGMADVLELNAPLITFLHGHTDQVWDVDYSPDNTTLVTGSTDGTIRFWDTISATQIGEPIITGADSIYSVAFSPNGDIVAAGGSAESITLWDVASGELVAELSTGHDATVFGLDFSPDGTILASAGVEGVINLWDVETGQAIGMPLIRHTDWIWDVAFSPDGSQLVSAGRDKTVSLWSVEKMHPLGPAIEGHKNSVASVAFSPNGSAFATGDADGKIIVWDVATQQPLGQPLSGHNNTVWGLAFSSDGKTLISSSADKTIKLWDLTTFEAIDPPLSGHTDTVSRLSLSPDGNILAAGSWDTTISLWDIDNASHLGQIVQDFPNSIWSMAFNPVGTILAVGDRIGNLTLLDGQSYQPLVHLGSAHSGAINKIAFNANGSIMATASDDDTVILWDMNTEPPQPTTLSGHLDDVTAVAFSPDGSLLAASDGASNIILWNTTSAQIEDTLSGQHDDRVNSVAFSPDGKILASGSRDKSIILWDMETRQPLEGPNGGFLDSHTSYVHTVTFSPDGKTLASGGRDNKVILWDVKNQQRLGQPLTEHSNFVYGIAFSPDGRLMASVGAGNELIIWDVATMRAISDPFEAHTGDIFALAFNPDGQTLVTGDRSGEVMLWEIDYQLWKDLACDIANRNLSPTEWEANFNSDYHSTCPDLPVHPDFYKEAATSAEEGDLEQAIKRLGQILDIDPTQSYDASTEAGRLAAQAVILEAEELIVDGKYDQAQTVLQEALDLDSSLNFDPADKVTELQADLLIEAGHNLANQGDLEGAVAKLEEAQALNPSLNLNPLTEAEAIVSEVLLEQAREEALAGNRSTAEDLYKQAEAMGATIDFDVNRELNRLTREGQIKQIEDLAKAGDTTAALAIITQIQEDDPQFRIPVPSWDAICTHWQGNDDNGEIVLAACEKAVAESQNSTWIRASRGRVQAIIGDIRAATADYEYAVNKLKENPLYQPQTSEWEIILFELKADINPFLEE